jgi:thiosulfate dehydrogenase [quinone] large subunit
MMQDITHYSAKQKTFLVLLRVFIGWHFLYEGLVKAMNPNWSSIGYLMDSKGFMAGFFYSLASNQSVLEVADFLNTWGLVAIGLGLILGCLTQIATLSGIILLAFYYLSHPAFVGVNYALPSEGSYLYINKILIEMAALVVLYVFPTGKIIGIDRLIFKKKVH